MRDYLISGGSSGIGLELCGNLGKRAGTHLTIITRDQARAAAAVKKKVGADTALDFIEADLADPGTGNKLHKLLDRALKRRPAAFIHSAGLALPCALRKGDGAKVQQLLQVNTLSFMEITRWLMLHHHDAGPCKVVALSAQAARHTLPNMELYAVAKAALEAYVRQAAPALLPLGISIYALAPGFVDTPMARSSPLWQLHPDFARYLTDSGLQPQGLIPPQAVADFILYLLDKPGPYGSGGIIEL